jgi:excinuclease ABC subunit C
VASLKEVIQRRYTKVLEGKKTPADFILVDGGKGQLKAAIEALNSLGIGDIPVAALAKKKEIIYTPRHKEGISLERTSPALQLLQRIRDEAHRFAISLHRRRREKKSFESILDGVTGIGQKRKQRLLMRYRTIDGIKAASLADLSEQIGSTAAAELKRTLNEEPSIYP